MGCGGGSLEPTTSPLTEGAEVSPQRYLADSVGAAGAVQSFWTLTAQLGPAPTPAELRAAAPALAAQRDAVRAAADRLDAAQLADQRLETQREDAVRGLELVLAAIDQVVAAAEAGNPDALAMARERLAAAITSLRERLAGPEEAG